MTAPPAPLALTRGALRPTIGDGMRAGVTLGLLLCLLFAAGCGGSQKATLLVAVNDSSGVPVDGAHVSIYGTSLRSATDASGNARISGIAPGVYLISVAKSGYYGASERETISRKASAQVSLTLGYVPPLGTFWEWSGQNPSAIQALSISNAAPLRATAVSYQQVCKQQYKLVTPPPPPPGWSAQNSYYVPSGGTWTWQKQTEDETDTADLVGTAVVGPRQLASGWHSGSAPVGSAKTWGACKP